MQENNASGPLVPEEARRNLLEWFRPFDSCLVAFSGGLDSTVVARAAAETLGERSVAVMARSDSCFRDEVDEARRVAESIPIRFVSLHSPEMDDPAYTANDRDRCYYCKKIRFRELLRYADDHHLGQVLDGSNRDDLDDYRPGRRAVSEFGIRSPLAELGLTKDLIRAVAKDWELPNWNKAASPCLSTRISYGLRITPERLRLVEDAEHFLRSLEFGPLRVRLHPDKLVRIEVPPEQISRFMEPALRQTVLTRFEQLGFQFVSVDLKGFRSGSMNVF